MRCLLTPEQGVQLVKSCGYADSGPQHIHPEVSEQGAPAESWGA